MPRTVSKKAASPQASTQRVSTRKKPVVTKVISTRRSVSAGRSKAVDKNVNTSRQTIRKSKRIILNKDPDHSVHTDDSTSEKKRTKPARTRTLRKNNEKHEKSVSKIKKETVRKGTSKSKNESGIKRGKIKKVVNKNVSGSRQMSLKESFQNHSKAKKLHSRCIVHNRQNGESVAKESVITNEFTPFVKVTRSTAAKKKKVPVYKSTPVDDSVNNEDEVYDFKFDVNDSKERIAKKRKKRPIKRMVTKHLQKNLYKKSGTKQKKADEKVQTVPSTTAKQEKKSETHVEEKASLAPSTKNPVSDKLMINTEEQVKGITENAAPSTTETPILQKDGEAAPKPTIVNVQVLRNRKVTLGEVPGTPNTENFKPFRPTNIFNKSNLQQGRMLNNSLFNKSLSPILKAAENFDPASPWRAPALFTFSKVKNVFQSTPQNRFEISTGRLKRSVNMESKNITRLKDRQKNYENIMPEKPINTNAHKNKNSISSRRFGTEITNFDHSMQSNSVTEEVSERVIIEPESPLPNVQSPNPVISSNANNFSKVDEELDKENTALNFQTPKKVPKKGLKKLQARSPLKSTENIKTNILKENFEPQPGPSGLQENKNLSEQRILRQSSLNNFLNITEMPESTVIKTHHGIFDDVHSTPVSGKPIRMQEEPDVEIKNAFGFNEDTTSEAISPPNENERIENKENIPQKTESNKATLKDFVPARLSIGQIRNTLLKKNAKKKVEEENAREAETNDVQTIKSSVRKEKAQFDVTSFSDTFDVLSETGELPDNTSNFALFTDLEPTHFKQPPKHSYKRKRAVNYSFSDESNEENEDLHVHEKKRKKVRKVKTENDKRLEEWVKTVNQTFDEIDHYDLVVE